MIFLHDDVLISELLLSVASFFLHGCTAPFLSFPIFSLHFAFLLCNAMYNTNSTNGRFDRARGVEIGNKDVKLEYLEEAFTTSNWIVRIYKIKPPNNRW